MRLAKLIFITCIISCCINTNGQGFLKYFVADKAATQAFSLTTQDSFFYVTGAVVDTSVPGAIKSFLTKFDYAGHELADTSYRPNGYIHFDMTLFQNGIITTSDGGLAATGVAVDTNGKYTILFTKFDSTGKFSFYKSIIPTTDSYLVAYGYQILERNNAYYILGDVETSDYYVEPVFMKIDLAGEVQFIKRYTNLPLSHDNQLSMCVLPDSNFLITQDRDDGNVNQWQTNLRTCFLEVDTAGSLIHQYNGPDNNTFASYAVAVTPDNKYLSCGSYFSGRAPYSGYIFSNYVAKWDTNFNRIWQLEVGGEQVENAFTDLKEDAQGNIILCGVNLDTINGYNGIVSKVGANGSLIWSRKYNVPTNLSLDISHNSLSNLALLSGGDILVTGSWQSATNNSPLGYQQVAWILRVDSNGCVGDEDCGLTTDISEPQQSAAPLQAVNLYPNPSNGIFTVNAQTPLPAATVLDVYDALGRKLQSQPLFNRNNLINLYYLPAGIYFYKIGNGLVNVAEGKLVIQK